MSAEGGGGGGGRLKGGKGGGEFHWATTRGKGGSSDSHLYIIEGLIFVSKTNKVTRPSTQRSTNLIWKYGFDSLLFLSFGLLTLISKKSVASFSEVGISVV